MKRYIKAILLAWLVFIGVDFLFHASLLASLWEQDPELFKSPQELAYLIPIGYGSFLLLTALIGYAFFNAFRNRPTRQEIWRFGLIFGALFALSNMMGLFSYVAIPIKHLIFFNLVYFIEIVVVVHVFYFYRYSNNPKKVVGMSILSFFLMLVAGIIIQNIV